jgi:hypothetical protein
MHTTKGKNIYSAIDILRSDVGGKLNALSSSDCLYPVVHEIGHDEKMDYLGDHEPVANVFWKQT